MNNLIKEGLLYVFSIVSLTVQHVVLNFFVEGEMWTPFEILMLSFVIYSITRNVLKIK